MNKINTIFIVALLLVGICSSAAFVSAQTNPDPIVRVGWEVVDEFQEISHSEQSSDWMFGPQPTITISYAENETDISENFYGVDVGDKLFINIIIPKSFLGEDIDLEIVRFWGSAGGGRGTERAIFVLEYNATSEVWATPITLHYNPGAQEPSLSNFMSADMNNNSYSETADAYEIIFAVTFTEAIVTDVFWTGMQAIDTLGRPVSPSWLSRLQSGEFITPPIALGKIVDPRDFSLPKYFYGDIVDTNGDITHYVGVNDTFIVRITSPHGLGDIVVPMAIVSWNEEYKQWINYSQPVGWPNSMYNETAEWEEIDYKIGPMLFLVHNETGTFALAGYPDISFEWTELDGGTYAWMLDFTMVENKTIDVSDFYVSQPEYTGEFDGENGVRWGGYFTNNTDMSNEPWNTGDVINPGEILWWSVVETPEGEQLYPRPEIEISQTMKLSFNADFIEAFVFDAEGNIADIGEQGEPLNFTFIIHKPQDMFNGSFVIDDGTNLFNVTTQLANYSVQLSGHGHGENDTHYWQYAASYNFTLDFIHNESRQWSVFVRAFYDKATNTRVGPLEIVINEWLKVNDFHLDIGAEVSKLYVNASFHLDAPDMVLDDAYISVGLIENIRLWSGADWIIWVPPEHPAYPSLVDHFKRIDLSNDVLWSPSYFRLGDVDIYVPQVWAVTDDGAIDLDGNTFTTEDQYFVKRTGYWEDWGNITAEGMNVNVTFDPTPGQGGDEFFAFNWMGAITLTMEFNANETYYWYHADDFSPVSTSEMEEIQDMLWADMGNDIPAPEYSYVAWLSRNWTIDMTQIPGLEAGSWTNTWFAWGSQQIFNVAISESSRTWATFRTEYAGMLIFDDDPMGASPAAPDFSIEEGAVITDEVSHVVLIDAIGSLEVRQPFGATNGTGYVTVSPETDISYGVSIYDVEVTIYPLRIQNGEGIRGPWQFRQSYEGAIGLNSTDFNYRITKATISEMSFDVSFMVDQVVYDAEDPTTWNHAVSFKVDQVIGEWDLIDFSDDAMEDRSLAINYFAVLGTATRTQYQAGSEPVTDTNGASTGANYYVFGDEDSPYANVSMGGLPYTWAGDNPAYSVEHISGSSTAPIGAFSLMYQSESGQSITQWNIDASMLFMTAGYEYWGGQEIRVDPVFVSYTSAHQSGPLISPTDSTIPNGGGDSGLMVLVAATVIIVVIACVVIRRRR